MTPSTVFVKHNPPIYGHSIDASVPRDCRMDYELFSIFV